MKKLYISGNYLIVDDGAGTVKEFALGHVTYEETNENFVLNQKSTEDYKAILKSDIANWYDEPGTTPFSEATARTLFRENTGFKIAPGGSGAGIWGIADATGTITYYNTVADANTAFVAGDVIQLFANVTETGTDEFNLINGAIYNLNGYTYENSNSGTNQAVTDNNVAISCTIMNGTLKRTGAAASLTNSIALHIDNVSTNVVLQNVTVINDTGTACRNEGTISGGRYESPYYTFHASGASSLSRNLYVDSTATRALYCAGPVEDSYSTTTSGDAVMAATSTRLVRVMGYAVSGIGITCVNATGVEFIDCVGISDTNYGISNGNSQIELHGCKSISYGGLGGLLTVNSYAHGCQYFSATSYNNVSGEARLCTFHSEAGNGIRGGHKLFNCVVSTDWDNTGAHAAYYLNAVVATLANCSFFVKNASANCVGTQSTSNTIYLLNANFNDIPTTPIGPNVQQTQVKTADAYGNIQVG